METGTLENGTVMWNKECADLAKTRCSLFLDN